MLTATFENLLPGILSKVAVSKLNATQKEAFILVHKWNKYFNAEEIAASIFDLWSERLFFNIWNDEFTVADIPMRYPSRDRTIELIRNEPDSKWFDNINTPEKEDLASLVNESFKYTCDSLERKYGSIGKSWEWTNVKATHIPHLGRIPGFGTKTLTTGGAKSTVNALSESNGPSWRMVIELGKTPKGHGVYPGGQSGNPGSPFYNDMTSAWAKGELYDLYLMDTPNDSRAKIISNLKITTK